MSVSQRHQRSFGHTYYTSYVCLICVISASICVHRVNEANGRLISYSHTAAPLGIFFKQGNTPITPKLSQRLLSHAVPIPLTPALSFIERIAYPAKTLLVYNSCCNFHFLRHQPHRYLRNSFYRL